MKPIYFSLIKGPVRTEDNGILTHLQKYSQFGFLFTLPFCFHIWYFWQRQVGSDQIGWMPGSESGIYCRTPGWRYDTELGYKWTWGYIGGHWD